MIDDYLYLKDTTAVFGVLFFEFLRRMQRLGLDIPALFCRSPKLHSADCGMQRLGHSYQIIEKMLRNIALFSGKAGGFYGWERKLFSEKEAYFYPVFSFPTDRFTFAFIASSEYDDFVLGNAVLYKELGK